MAKFKTALRIASSEMKPESSASQILMNGNIGISSRVMPTEGSSTFNDSTIDGGTPSSSKTESNVSIAGSQNTHSWVTKYAMIGFVERYASIPTTG